MKILTPENTVRRNSGITGDKFIEVLESYGEITFTVFEIGEVAPNTYGIKRLAPIAIWQEGERGPIEYKDLPVRYNNFIPYPKFGE